jgi:hypothetical protein
VYGVRQLFKSDFVGQNEILIDLYRISCTI